MWFLGLIIGTGFGIVFGHTAEWALTGLALGLLLDKRNKTRDKNSEYQTVRELQQLQNRLTQLEQNQLQLQQQLARLQQGQTTAAESVPKATTAPATPLQANPDQPAVADWPSLQSWPESSNIRQTEQTVKTSRKDWQPANPDLHAPSPLTDLFKNLLSGNILAKIGVLLLLIGIASALKVAAENGWFPAGLRLLLTAIVGIAMIIFGYSRRNDERHGTFNQVLQGGGFGLLYLLSFFALSWYHLISPVTAFLAFALLGISCTGLALKQNAAVLAVSGITGAFLAPILAELLREGHFVLLSYYLLLNISIFSMAWFKNWPSLTITGFILTFIVSLGWAEASYQPGDYPGSQIFLVLFFLLYSGAPVLADRLSAPGQKALQQPLIWFGTPAAALYLQKQLVAPWPNGLAISAFLAGLYYLALWQSLKPESNKTSENLRQSQLGIGLAFLTLAIPLYFGVRTTITLWALEGTAVLWMATRQKQQGAQWLGLIVQLLAGLWLIFHSAFYDPSVSQPLINDNFTGGLFIALAGLTSAALLRKPQNLPNPPTSNAVLIWGLAWWFFTGIHEINQFTDSADSPPASLLFIAFSGLAAELLGTRLNWPALRLTLNLVLPAAMLTVINASTSSQPFLANAMALVLPFAMAVHYLGLYRQTAILQKQPLLVWFSHLAALWFLSLILTHDGFLRAQQWSSSHTLWPNLAMGIIPILLIALVNRGLKQNQWPLRVMPESYRRDYMQPMAFLLAIWFIAMTFREPGGLQGHYIPFLNPLDLVLLLALWTIHKVGKAAWNITSRGFSEGTLFMLSLIGLMGLAARMAHHLGGVPFASDALFNSDMGQATLSLLWSLLAITVMIFGSRTRDRTRWFAGFSLLAVVGIKLLFIDLIHSGTAIWSASLIAIALLVLTAAYFSPMPPKND